MHATEVASTHEPIITYRGQKVGLGPVTREALPSIQRWWNDPKIAMPTAASLWPNTEKDQEEWFEKYASKGDGSTLHFLVYALDSMKPIGMLFLFQINYRNQTAWVGGYGGEKEYWGRGYADEASKLLMQYAFDVLGLHSLTAAIHADNKSSLRVAKLAGFVEIGRQREGVRRGQEYFDIILLDCLVSDYMAGAA